ncbi:oligopeptide ABC transporter permease [Desmospora activa]|uniref:Peptide/nickel transport system permease protein n=1 Tax=Desmospora activa DSM 45169 TaxID=1121389 RepID=A0A2T4Z888_9BACL|nr:oligopeptide ABC transporter permease [Desmospora activa]PTM58107.1 peptide/nickel transport system permease protein [Desmospora activa DSM 45169]
MSQPAVQSDIIEPQLNQTPEKKKGKSPLQLAFRRFIRNKMAIAGIIILTIITLTSVFAPLIANHDPYATDLYNTRAEPSADHWLGTDDSGRDLFSRLLYGGRISLLIGFATMVGTVCIGAVVGALAGYYGRWIDAVVMRISDVVLALPSLLLILFVVAILPQSGAGILILVLCLTVWPTTARLVRAEFLSLREQEYVLSARSIGAKDSRIIFRHMLPNTVAPIIVNATLLMGSMITIEAALSFLGFGVPEPTPTWGNMLNAARNFRILQNEPWVWMPPGFLIVLTVLSINFIGDGLRDAFDTKSSRR